jgi:polyphosphate kinase 2 (PPK2 family)
LAGQHHAYRRKVIIASKNLAHLQFELIKLQEWVRLHGLQVCVLFEGRDAAGRGGVIKRITQSACQKFAKVSISPREIEAPDSHDDGCRHVERKDHAFLP